MAADVERATLALEKAVALNPSHARAHSILGQAYVAAGRRVGLEHMRLSARLSPGTDNVGHVLAHFAIGEYEQAIVVFRTRGRRSPVPLFEHALACASLALLGDEAGARAELVRLRGVHPGFSSATFATMARPGRSDVSDRILEGLRKAGLVD
jgi:Flp pilus assembly protein TadD